MLQLYTRHVLVQNLLSFVLDRRKEKTCVLSNAYFGNKDELLVLTSIYCLGKSEAVIRPCVMLSNNMLLGTLVGQLAVISLLGCYVSNGCFLMFWQETAE